MDVQTECFGCNLNALVAALGRFIYSKLQAWLTDDPMQQPTFGHHRCWRSIGFETLEALQDGTESSPRISKQHLMVCLNMVVYGCVPLCEVVSLIPSPKESPSFTWQSTSKSCSVPLMRTGVGLMSTFDVRQGPVYACRPAAPKSACAEAKRSS